MSPLPLHRALTRPGTNTTFNLFSYFDTIRDTGIWSLIDRWLIRNTHNHNKTRDNALQTFSSAASQHLRWPATQLRREVRCVCFGWSSLPCTTFKGRYLVESLVFSYSPSSPTQAWAPHRSTGARTGQSSFLGIVTLFSPIFPSLRSSSHHNLDKVAK